MSEDRQKDRFLKGQPDALQFERLDVAQGFQLGVFLGKIRKWFLSRKLRGTVLIGAMDTDGMIRYDAVSDLITVLRDIQDNGRLSKNLASVIFMAGNTIERIDDSVDGEHEFTTPGGTVRVWRALTMANNNRACETISFYDDGTTEFDMITSAASGANVFIDVFRSLGSNALILGPGDVLTAADASWQAGDTSTFCADYVDISIL